MALSLVIGVMAANGVMADGNIQDKPYHMYGQKGYWYATDPRDKTDDSSAYIFHKQECGVRVEVKNAGVNYSANGSFYYTEVGTWRYLPNYIKESGKGECYLLLSPEVGGEQKLMQGLWSPDSI